MQNLLELVRLVKHINLKPTDLLVDNGRKKAKTDIFYEKLLNGGFRSDQEAAQFFFKTDSSNSNYKNLKRSFKEKLTNSLFFINPAKAAYSSYTNAYVYCAKNFALAKILLILQARRSGFDLGQKVLKKALEYELTEFIVQASKLLRSSLVIITGNEEKFNYYNDIFKKHLKLWEIESQAEEYYSRLVLPYADSKTKVDDTYQKGLQFYEDLAPYLEKYQAPFLHFSGNLIRVVAYLSINDYQTVIKLCKQCIDFFEQKPYVYRAPIIAFTHNMLICYIQLKNYEDGKEAAIKALSIVKIGSISWFTNKELHLMLALHSKRYKEAFTILYEAIKHHKFKTLRESLKERWLIHQAYIHFLVLIGKIEKGENNRKIKIGKFLNSVPNFSKDKRGLNIPILIIQILFMIVKKDYEQSINRFEAIKKYCSRYLRDRENLRSNCFINMLLQIPISNFHKAGVERRAKKYYDKLMATPIDIARQAHEVEIIPYEDLWEFVLESLETRFYQLKK